MVTKLILNFMREKLLRFLLIIIIFILIVGSVSYIWPSRLSDWEGVRDIVTEPVQKTVVGNGAREAANGDGDKSNVVIDKEAFDTSNWNVYRDEKLGFEITYPPNWEFNVNDQTREHYLNDKLVTVSFIKKGDDFSPIWIDIYDLSAGDISPYSYTKRETIHISGVEGYKLVQEYDGISDIFKKVTTVRLLKKGIVFDIHYGKVFWQKSYEDIFEQILTHFRFL